MRSHGSTRRSVASEGSPEKTIAVQVTTVSGTITRLTSSVARTCAPAAARQAATKVGGRWDAKVLTMLHSRKQRAQSRPPCGQLQLLLQVDEAERAGLLSEVDLDGTRVAARERCS